MIRLLIIIILNDDVRKTYDIVNTTRKVFQNFFANETLCFKH